VCSYTHTHIHTQRHRHTHTSMVAGKIVFYICPSANSLNPSQLIHFKASSDEQDPVRRGSNTYGGPKTVLVNIQLSSRQRRVDF